MSSPSMPRWVLASTIVLALISADVWAGQQPPPKTEKPATAGSGSTALATLLITGMPQLGAVEDEKINFMLHVLLRNWGELAPEAREFDHYKIRFSPVSEPFGGNVIGVLSVESLNSDRWNSAPSILTLALKRLQEAMLDIHRASVESFVPQILQADKRVQEAKAGVARATQDLDGLRVYARQIGASLRPQAELLTSVQRDLVTLNAESIGLQARRDTLVKQIEQTSADLDAGKAEQQSVLAELEEVVKLRQQQLERIRQAVRARSVSESEASEAAVELFTARAELALRRREIAQGAGSQRLGRLNDQLIDVQIEIAATEARLRIIEKQFEELCRSADDDVVIRYERARRALDSALAEKETAAAELAKAKRARDAMLPPRITVIRPGEKPKK